MRPIARSSRSHDRPAWLPFSPRHASHALAWAACAFAAAGVGSLALGVATATAAEAAAPAARKTYDIPAGPLEATLNRFGREAGILLSYPSDLTAGLQSSGLVGTHSVAEAWPLLLKGTGLAAEERAGGGWSLVKRPEPPPTTGGASTEAVTTLPTVTVSAPIEAESGAGPVRGYAATRTTSGTKTDAPLLETPQSIAVVGAAQITDQKATSVSEALAYTPGVIVDPGYANSYDVFYSRGFRLQDGNGSVYRDGLKLGGSGWATGQQEPYGLERIELLKGAASVLYGAAAPGGVLNVVTKQPNPGHVNEVVAEAGNYAHRAASADLGAELSETWTGRLVLLARNAETSVDYIPNDTRYIAPSLRWSPHAGTSVTLLAHYTERRTAYIWGVPVEGSLLPSPFGKLPRDRFVGEPDFDRQDTRQSSLGWLVSHRLADGLELQHGLRWIDSENHVRFTNLRGPSADNPRVYERRAFDELETTRGVSTDTRLQADFDTGSVRHKAVAGIDYSRHHIGSVWELATLGELDLFDPTYGDAPGAFTPLFDDQDKQRRLGFYLQDQVKFGAVTALAGVRRDEVRSELNGDTEKTGATTGRVGVVWELASGIAPFASWSQSFEPVSGLDNDNERYKPTRGKQVELGLRLQRGAFMASAAVFDLVQTNVLKDREDLPRSVQTGEARSRGLELEAKGPVARNVQVIASYAYTDAEVTESEDPTEIGQPMSYQPRHQAALWGRFDNVGVRGLHVGLGARHTGTTEDFSGGTGASVPAATTFDALVGYTTGPWTLRLNVNNVTDKKTLLCSSGWCVYGDGLRATSSLAYRW